MEITKATLEIIDRLLKDQNAAADVSANGGIELISSVLKL